MNYKSVADVNIFPYRVTFVTYNAVGLITLEHWLNILFVPLIYSCD